ncbi:MAG TPA: TadA family conjugal transfer-associated ATPase [Nocardioides sp.]|uniref:TadA family conjugal transfer-associated ATPase n=1 Tax=Nocardioides sp. TaxID=35761 RepID=UPI002E32FF4C|nr:TadA family conjugal transfer-associated ATPase [Nocardioides sp.]HEX3932394.1 TadA family conjugal transfer-associated ATPase [Nocardioides sp.]
MVGTADLVEEVRERLARDPGDLTPHRVAEALRTAGRPVGDATVLAVHEALRRDVVGAGPLEPLLALPDVTDVLVNGPDQVYLDRGSGLERTQVGFADDDAVRRLAQRLAASGGRRLDDASPHVDVRLRDGVRLHAVLSPLARPGTLLSLRVPHRRVLSLADLLAAGTINEHGSRLLRTLVTQRLAFLVSGGTGSGKTTVLNTLLSLASPGHRLVLVEDASELRPDHPHVVGLEARPPNIEGAGEITLRTLVRQALRMRPDRLVVGEVRGAEVPLPAGNRSVARAGARWRLPVDNQAWSVDNHCKTHGITPPTTPPTSTGHSSHWRRILGPLDVAQGTAERGTGGQAHVRALLDGDRLRRRTCRVRRTTDCGTLLAPCADLDFGFRLPRRRGRMGGLARSIGRRWQDACERGSCSVIGCYG